MRALIKWKGYSDEHTSWVSFGDHLNVYRKNNVAIWYNGNIETIRSLYIHLKKYVAAYRKSYRLCRSPHLTVQFVSGVIGYLTSLTLVPAIPLLFSIACTIPARVSVKKSQNSKKKNLDLKHNTERVLKQFLTEARIMSDKKIVSVRHNAPMLRLSVRHSALFSYHSPYFSSK